jgi:hypothetical protein
VGYVNWVRVENIFCCQIVGIVVEGRCFEAQLKGMGWDVKVKMGGAGRVGRGRWVWLVSDSTWVVGSGLEAGWKLEYTDDQASMKRRRKKLDGNQRGDSYDVVLQIGVNGGGWRLEGVVEDRLFTY